VAKTTGALRSLRHRNYRLFFAANALSNIGSWAQRIAQDWLVLQLTNSSKELGIVTGLQFLPSLLLSMYGGRLADRFNKRKLLFITTIGTGATATTLGTLVVTHTVAIWHVYVLAFVLGVFGAIDGPIRFAFTPELVGKEDLANAVSLNSANFHGGRLIGPALSGALIAWFGTGPSFFFNGATYIFVVLALLRMNEKEMYIEHKPSLEAKARDGLRYVLARKDIMAVMLTVFFAGTFGLNFQIFSAMMAQRVFGKGPAEFGSLGTFIAIGSFGAAVTFAKLDRRRGPRFIGGMAAVFGTVVIGQSLMPNYVAYGLVLPFLGFSALTTMISSNSYIQQTTDPAIRGRVMGVYLMVFMGGTPFASPLIGWFMDHFGVRQTIAGCGAIVVAAALTVAFIYRNNRARPASINVEDVLQDYEGFKG
jgi:MFS family permease